jgi:Protein of unknown function DUF262/Protein of unknown function (DUF1524)
MTIQVSESPVASLLYGTDLYRVPLYQRDFSWTEEEISQFWEDFVRSMNDPEPYFFGSFILVGTDNQTLYEVLDGQQRLVAFSLLLAATRDNCPESIAQQTRTLLVEGLLRLDIGGVFGGGQTYRLHLNRRDDPFFAPIAQGNPPGAGKKPSHKLIRKAYEFLSDKVEKEMAANAPAQFVTDLMQSLTERLRLIRIIMTDMASAQMVFEAVNSAGLDLSQADLIKNHLLRTAPESEAEALYHAWETVSSRVEEGRGQVTDFVRTSFNSRFDFVRKNDLYKRVRTTVGNGAGHTSSAFLLSLTDDAVFWSQLRTGSLTTLPAAQRDAVTKDLGDLWAFNIKLVEVPLLALRPLVESDPIQFARAVRWFRDFFVRYSVVGGKASNVIELEFSQLANDLRAGRITLNELHAKLEARIPKDDEFRESFKAFAPKVQRVARTVLARINDASETQNVITTTLAAGGYVHLEHVVPQSPGNWQEATAKFESAGLSYDEVLNNIGNLTLLPPTVNIEISNDPFTEKRWAYEGRNGPDDPNQPHPAPINAFLAELAEFGPDEFAARRQWLADRAISVWTLEV